MFDLHGKRVAMILGGNYEDVEATDPKAHLLTQGADVTVVAMELGEVRGKKGTVLAVDTTFDNVSVDQFDALVIPGGGSPERLRIHERPVEFTREFVASGKPVAAICHGPQLLISADVLKGKTITCVAGIRDDVKNAGATYVDQPVVVDDNIITSRVPSDLPKFNEALSASLAGVALESGR